jgi:hypothetical protein
MSAAEVLARHPHEARVQRYAYAALALATIVAAFLALRADGTFLAFAAPTLALLAIVAAGAVVGVVAVVRRRTVVALAAGALLALGVVPDGHALHPGVLGYAAGLLLGGLVLAFGELVHQTSRYDAAHRLIEEEGVSEEGLDRVTDEALRTLGERALLALGLAALPVLAALALATVGPAAWRAGIETSSTLGVTVLALALFGGVSLFILTRGSTLRSPQEPEQEAVAVADVEVLE